MQPTTTFPFKIRKIPRDFWLSLTAYLTFLAVAVIGLISLPDGRTRGIANALLAVFGLLLLAFTLRRHPAWLTHLYLAIQTALIAWLLAFEQPGGVFLILFFILSAQAMLTFPSTIGLVWIGVFTATTGGVLGWVVGREGGALSLLPYIGGYLLFGAFAYSLAQAEIARKESQALLGDLQIAHQKLQDYASHAEELAIEQERGRLAREVHDTLGHRLTVAAVQLEAAQRLIRSDPERAERMVGTGREQVREGLHELRGTVATLRTPIEAELPIAAGLQRLAESFKETTGIPVQTQISVDIPDLPHAHRLAVFRAAQEALTNVQKHAAAASVELVLTCSGSTIRLLVADDGRGLPIQITEQGYGLLGLRERAALLGGGLSIENRPGGGVQLTFWLPLPVEEKASSEIDPLPLAEKHPGTALKME
jgi:signal transduction histidine kinase